MLITRESGTRGRHVRQLPLAEAFEHEIRGFEKEIVRLPRGYYEDWKAYEQWQQGGKNREGIVKALVEIMSAGHWTERILHRMASQWNEHGQAGLTPDDMQMIVNIYAEEFGNNIEFARELWQQYPELVTAEVK